MPIKVQRIEMADMQAIAQVHEYYQEAFGQLITLAAAMLTIIGIVMPIVMAIIQSRQNRKEVDFLSKKIEQDLQQISERVEAKMLEQQAKALVAFEERSDKVITDLKREVDAKQRQLKAAIFHVQAVSSFRTKAFIDAVESCCHAVPGYSEGREFANLRRLLQKVLLPSMEKLQRQDFEDRAKLKERIAEAAKQLRDMDDDGAFQDTASDIEAALRKALAREKDAASNVTALATASKPA